MKTTNVGNWKIEVNNDSMPQKVATAFEKLNGVLMGVQYDFIAYLGSQEVNGVNHAVLARQIITTGLDAVSVAVLIFHEKPGEIEITQLMFPKQVVVGDNALGGTTISVDKVLDPDGVLMKIWQEAFAGYVGISMRPIAYLGNQETNGIEHIFAATAEPMNLEGEKQAVIVRINQQERRIHVMNFLDDRGSDALNYAFNW